MRLYLFLHPVNRIIDMTSKLKLFTLAAVVSLCSGCEDRYSGPDLKGSDLSFSVQVLDYDGTLAEHRWTEDDRIGISVAGMSDYYDPDTNVAFDYNPETGLFEPVNDNIIIKGTGRVLLAYYPWTGAENQVPAEVSVNIENGVPNIAGSRKLLEWAGDQHCSSFPTLYSRQKFAFHVIRFDGGTAPISLKRANGILISAVHCPCPFQTFPCQSCFVRNPDGVPKKEVKRKPR